MLSEILSKETILSVHLKNMKKLYYGLSTIGSGLSIKHAIC
jgi:hypothetical protein